MIDHQSIVSIETMRGKADRMLAQIGARSPHATAGGVYDDMPPDWWTSGFWPGMLWVLYDLTGEARYREAAWPWDERIEACFTADADLHHDVGFQFLLTAALKHRITGDTDARRRGLLAATFLAGRFNLAGRFLRAWNHDLHGRVIIDSAMNLSLLFWASAETGDPRYRQIATAHAGTLLDHFQRPDGSVHHMLDFDPASGAPLRALAGQGLASESAWSRGQAWAIYGFAAIARETGEERFLEAARRVADFFLGALPLDGLPPWDFHATGLDEPKDTSAAACAASGMLELARLLGPIQGRVYRWEAASILTALTGQYALWDDPAQQGILRGGTGHRPAGRNVDVSLIYGDYFYLEALAKLRGWERRVF